MGVACLFGESSMLADDFFGLRSDKRSCSDSLSLLTLVDQLNGRIEDIEVGNSQYRKAHQEAMEQTIEKLLNGVDVVCIQELE